MSEIMVAAGVPEVVMGSNPPAVAANTPSFSGKWEDMGKDLAAIAAEMAPQTPPAQPEAGQPAQAVVTPPAVTPAPVPATPAAAPVAEAPAVEVPEKFRGPDGKLDSEKLMKSYFEAEKSLKQAQNKLGAAPVAATPAAPVAAPAVAPQGQLTPFELQVAQDLFSQGGFTEQQAMAQARVMVKLTEAKHRADTAATFAEVNQFRETLAQQNQRIELQSLAEKNPEVLTPQGYADLVKVREENPWINNAPEPWKAAAHFLIGQRQLYGQSGLVNIPTPKGAQNAVPPLPVTPTQTAPNPIALNSPADVMAHVKSLSPEQEAIFWKSMGGKWDSPRPYKGV